MHPFSLSPIVAEVTWEVGFENSSYVLALLITPANRMNLTHLRTR